MGIKYLQEFLETHCSTACVSVDLLKIAKGFVPRRRGQFEGSSRFCLVVDAESCLDRLYGGYYSDWVCGGQWNRVTTFLNSLVQACNSVNMELVVFFNGALESQKLTEWFADQAIQKGKVDSVFRHTDRQGKPPPKVWWTPPVFLQGTLRMALRQMGVGVACSMDDHVQEVIGYCREHGLQGIIAQNAVYSIFDPPRYFSSHNLKLTYKGSLETKEYIMDQIAKCLDLNPNRFCIFAAMLGNHILPDEDLYEFYRELLAKNQELGKPSKLTPESAIRGAVDFVRSLPVVDNLDAVGDVIFRNYKSNKRELIAKFRQCVQYYMNGTQDGFLKYGPNMAGSQGQSTMQHLMQNKQPQDPSGPAPQIVVDPPTQNAMPPSQAPIPEGVLKNETLAAVTSSSSSSSSGSSPNRNSPETSSWNMKLSSQMQHKPARSADADSNLPKITPEIMRVASERHQKGLMSPWIYQLLSQGEVKFCVALEDERDRELPTAIELYRPVRQTVYSVLFNLNKLKIDSEKQVKEQGDAPPSKAFQVAVKEWIVRRGTTRPSFERVIAEPVDWKTPSIERMWLGTKVEDKSRRLRAFLTCMLSANKLMINTTYVPQHLLILCCVLRYILQYGKVLRRQELDAFLAMAVSPRLHDVQTMQDLMLPSVSHRGIQLASLFMSGVETAVFSNDVCGSPIPWNVCAPWHFFDGKLFHYKLLKANENLPLIDICDGQIDQVRQVERMRQAVMEDLHVEFLRPHLSNAALFSQYPQGPPGPQGPQGPYPPFSGYQQGGGDGRGGILPPPPFARGMRPAGMQGGGVPAGMSVQQGPPKPPGRGRGILGRSPVDNRGGQLEIAGVVVGSWGPNLSGGNGGGRSGPGMSPRVMSVGGQRRGYDRGDMGMPNNMRMREMAMREEMEYHQGGMGMRDDMGMHGDMGMPNNMGMRTGGGMGMRGGFGMRGGMGMRGMPLRGGMGMRGGMAMRGGMGMRGRGGLMFRGAMSRGFRGGRIPPLMYGMGRGLRMPERSYGRPVPVRGVKRPRVRVRPRVPTKTKDSKTSGKGRGMTIETVSEGAEDTVLNGEEEEEVETTTGDEFADAEEGNMSPVGKGVNTHDGIHSPDSGIHGDKSATELNVTA